MSSTQEAIGTRTLCKHCDHFVEEDFFGDDVVVRQDDASVTIKDKHGEHKRARYIHLEDGEQEFDHDPEPGETRDDWQSHRPDLFEQHPDAIGPNSIYHNRRGKTDKNSYDGTVTANAHRITFRYWGFEAPLTDEVKELLAEEAEERATAMTAENYQSGELNCCVYVDGMDEEEEIRGWWEIDR